jgi:GNAT superfamily N-acetyltransferase
MSENPLAPAAPTPAAGTTPGGFTFRRAYWDDPAARAAYRSFLVDIHGLDLGLWEQRGFWDDRYVPYSLFDGDRVVASVCLYSLDMALGGRRCRLGQFSGVGTRPELRRRGLNRWLTEQAMRDTAGTHEGYFLFADDDAVPFYQRCGFVPVEEQIQTLAVPALPRPRAGLRKLDPADENDRALVYRLACDRAPVSEVLGVLAPRLVMFHFLYTLADCTYHVPDLGAVIAFRAGGEDGAALTLYDVIGREVPPFEALHPYLAPWPHREVAFHFVPDRMDATPTAARALPGSNTHVDARLQPLLQRPGAGFVFPFVAHA